MKLYAWLAGLWCGVLWFFTFGVARPLFAFFPRERAGEVTTALFPVYFGVALVLGALCTVALARSGVLPRRKMSALGLQVLAILALASIPLLIQPVMQAHPPGTPGFARWHGASMALNLLALLVVPVSTAVALTGRREP